MSAWSPCPAGTCQLEPCRGWSGRYRCTVCRVLYYRQAERHGACGREDLLPYRCPLCGGPTTGYGRAVRRDGRRAVRPKPLPCPACAGRV
jgi:hypothetical protein